MGVTFLQRIWSSVAERGRALARLPQLADPEARAIDLAHSLLSESGEATGAARAMALLDVYRSLEPQERHRFHIYLAREFSPPQERLRAAVDAYLAAPSPLSAAQLHFASEAPRQELLRRMNVAPGATQILVRMREELLAANRHSPELQPLEQDLRQVLTAWFNRGFLELRRIDWDISASVLEKLIAYEAVHEIHGWDDLRRRLAPDRRCFAFFHPAMPDEPLIFVEVALCRGLAGEIAPLLSLTMPRDNFERAEAAIFYSISNCQPGLRGISFGSFLIKQVVEELSSELPGLQCFATLSPVPSFRGWLDRHLAEDDETLLSAEERAAIAQAGDGAAQTGLAGLLANKNWEDDDSSGEPLRSILLRLCARYLTAVNEGNGPDDPVARFHLGNGARLERIHWRANLGARGLEESYGVMVNYLYDPELIEANHEKFASQRDVAYSSQVADILGESSWRTRGLSLVRSLRHSQD
ncbi:MAG TPA: malonyl-CoA decarboxylase [Micropepsaceae bacterium]|nr:malonyl-CoA decarboxylase [Micropepsaceae bacterium]